MRFGPPTPPTFQNNYSLDFDGIDDKFKINVKNDLFDSEFNGFTFIAWVCLYSALQKFLSRQR